MYKYPTFIGFLHISKWYKASCSFSATGQLNVLPSAEW